MKIVKNRENGTRMDIDLSNGARICLIEKDGRVNINNSDGPIFIQPESSNCFYIDCVNNYAVRHENEN